jgi:hypothetical protein
LTTSTVLVLTGTGGSGKGAVSSLLAESGRVRVCEDEIWASRFGRNRGPFGSAEQRRGSGFTLSSSIAWRPRWGRIATSSSTRPVERHGIGWELRVLHPRLEVAVARDAARRVDGFHSRADLLN